MSNDDVIKFEPRNIGLKVGAEAAAEKAPEAPGSISGITWDKYIDWRKTKCRPFDHVNGPGLLNYPPEKGELPGLPYSRALDEVNQAVLELIGEASELAELFHEHGVYAYVGALRERLIDECGDILFCACWAFDAWGVNPLSGCTKIELVELEADDPFVLFGKVLADGGGVAAFSDENFVGALSSLTAGVTLAVLAPFGLMANSLKKLSYQRRAQSVETQVDRITDGLIAVGAILAVANATTEDAIIANMRKLDARFPDGYQPGVGGGIREGAGK